MDETYKIVRFYQNSSIPKDIVETGLTLEEAKEHCEDDETSSKTCTSAEGLRRTEEKGAWFDGFQKE
jgi:hypothetical protein